MNVNDSPLTVNEGTPRELVGAFRVERTAGLLPPIFSKRIRADGRGLTAIAGLPLFPFRVTAAPAPLACVLRYVGLPVRDELCLMPDGWNGRGLLFGREFCRFRLIRTA